MDSHLSYIGRFAPSPTGPLHFGSLIAALASFLDARHNQGKWLVRIEDLDPPREQPGADTLILKALERFALTWDGDVLYQSQRLDAYESALGRLMEDNRLFPCICSRKEAGHVYGGKCRTHQFGTLSSAYATRLIVDKSTKISFNDKIWRYQQQNMDLEVGDFIIKRKDGLIAYQLAVTVDDDFQQITQVVRGADLIDSTFRQLYLQQLLGFHKPRYAHVPLMVDSSGHKLSKQAHAPAIDLSSVPSTLVSALQALQQAPPRNLISATPEEIILWGIDHWQLDKITTEPIPIEQISPF